MTTPKKRLKTSILHVRVSPETKQQILDLAESQGRTLTNLIEWWIKKEAKKNE